LGIYTVSLKVTSANSCTTISTNTISITDFTVTVSPASSTICSGSSMSLIGVGAITYTWSPGSGLGNTTGSVVIANPTTSTTYTVFGNDGACTNTAVATVSVIPSPTVTTNSNLTICSGTSATLTAGGGVSYTWSPSSSLSSSTGSSVTASPATLTTYTVSGYDGACTNTAVATVSVVSSPTITTSSGTTICNGSSTTLTASGATSYTWIPGNTLNSNTGSSVTASPISLTTYTVTGSDGICTNTAVTTVSIHPDPTVTISSNISICNGSTGIFTAGGAQTYTWSPSTTLSSSTGSTVTANPSVNTTYSVIGTDINGCQDTAQAIVTILPDPVPNINLVNTCINMQPVSFDGSGSTIAAGTNTAYAWAYGDSGTGSGQITNHIYSSPSIYNVTLTVTSDQGCQSTLVKSMEIYPKPNVSITNGNACDTKPLQLTGNDPSNNISLWLWDFDNNVATLEGAGQTVNYVFPSVGNQTVTLISETNQGCRDTLRKVVYIDYKPTPLFTVDQSQGCSEHCVTFTDQTLLTSPAVIGNWKWIFGDGTTLSSSNPNPSHCYSNSTNQPDTFDVKLIVTTDKGCADSLEKTDFITVYPKPTAQYEVDANGANVVTPLVYFNNESSNYTRWWWSFGDQTKLDTSNVSPTHFYNSETADSYLTYLIVANQYGCKDTASIKVDIGQGFTFYMPNAFTPDGDEVNDRFTGKGIGIAEYEMWIYDRWGETIFYTDDIDKGWDGKVQGRELASQQGVYVWIVKLKDVLGKPHNYKGHVTLIKTNEY
jgi:trimeric autotransporter adhesin